MLRFAAAAPQPLLPQDTIENRINDIRSPYYEQQMILKRHRMRHDLDSAAKLVCHLKSPRCYSGFT